MGFPNSGKSSILASLTNASPVIADYPLTTLLPLPGMMPFENVQIQLIDLPAIGNESTDGWVSGILRNTDAFLVVLDLSDEPEAQMELILEQLGRWNIHIAAEGPADQRGIRKRALIAANKSDLPGAGENFQKFRERWGGAFTLVPLSILKKENLEELKRAIFDVTGIIRIYSKPPGKEPNMAMPFTIHAGCTVIEFAEHIHKDFLSRLKFARIWGSSKFDGQKVERSYVLKDRDIVELHT